MANHYVYKLEDPITNEFYFGSRTCKCEISDDPYMGSYKTWKPIDKSRLIKTILKSDFETRTSCMRYESIVIGESIDLVLNRNYHIPNEGFHKSGISPVNKGIPNPSHSKFMSGDRNPRFNKGKSVIQYDSHGKFMRKWDNVRLITEKLRINNIGTVCNGNASHAGGFIWRWYDNGNIPESILVETYGHLKRILQFDMDSNFIREYSSTKSASDALGIRASSITNALKGRYSHSGGYKWKYKIK